MSARLRSLLLLASLAAAAGCHESKVETYSVPHEADPQLPAGAAMPSADAPSDSPPPMAATGGQMTGNVPVASGPGLAWTAPADWQAQPAGAMRKASFAISGPEGRAELSVTAFPGDVGGELANVNRWRGQVGLSPLAAEDLDGNVQRTVSNGLHFTIVDLGASPAGSRILGAIVPFGDGVWFFKLSGPGALLERQKPAFLRFLKSVKAVGA